VACRLGDGRFFYRGEVRTGTNDSTFVPGGGSTQYKCEASALVPSGATIWYKCEGFVSGGEEEASMCPCERPIRFERSRNAVKGPRFITQLTNRKTSSLQHERSRSAVIALIPVQAMSTCGSRLQKNGVGKVECGPHIARRQVVHVGKHTRYL
jgi:hypothetical protein